jgi:flagellar motility protein MotE (MotC chaperone)
VKRVMIILAMVLVLAKLIAVADIALQKPAKAIAQTDSGITKDEAASPDRALLYSIQKRQTELNRREELLKADEQRLTALKKEISDKIEVLKQMEVKMTAALEIEKNSEVKRLKELAKVYESMPPAKAGAMLTKLDVKTAAGITVNMKRDRAGAVWGHLEPQKAVDITKEITKQGGISAVE